MSQSEVQQPQIVNQGDASNEREWQFKLPLDGDDDPDEADIHVRKTGYN